MLSRKLLVTTIATIGLATGVSGWAASASAKSNTAPATSAVVSAAPININTATLDALENIKGLGPTKAQAIVDYRNKNGNFQTLQDLQKVPGIGPKLFDKIQSQVTIG